MRYVAIRISHYSKEAVGKLTAQRKALQNGRGAVTAVIGSRSFVCPGVHSKEQKKLGRPSDFWSIISYAS